MNDVLSAAATPVARLIDEFHKLPGIGPKSAQRLAYHILRTSADDAHALAQAIVDVKEQITFCSSCQNLTEIDPCRICRSDKRDSTVICVVEEPLDILAIERTRSYKGLYHVLHGVISPIEGVGPEDIHVPQLLHRVAETGVREVIIATDSDIEGEATAVYLQRSLAPLGIAVTRPAHGLPVGGDLEYADELTLARALSGRRAF